MLIVLIGICYSVITYRHVLLIIHVEFAGATFYLLSQKITFLLVFCFRQHIQMYNYIKTTFQYVDSYKKLQCGRIIC